MKTTKTLTKLVAGAAFAAAAMTAIAEPANAGVSVGIGIGLPGPGPAPVYPRERWCYYHPGACGAYAPGPTLWSATFIRAAAGGTATPGITTASGAAGTGGIARI